MNEDGDWPFGELANGGRNSSRERRFRVAGRVGSDAGHRNDHGRGQRRLLAAHRTQIHQPTDEAEGVDSPDVVRVPQD